MQRLNIDLLPHIIYPDIRVRIADSGVPAAIMEDEVTRQLEEQQGDAGRARAVADYIAGMTDRYAIAEYERTFNPSI